jgi:DNA-binding NtrC family response regulator
VLQESCFTPVGANRDVKTDVRIIAASHKPFEEMIKIGTFREDLFYRLNVLPVYLPALRDRVADIPFLVDYYVKYFNNVHHLEIKGATDEALEQLKKHSWPGNIRELRNVIEHSFIIESSDYITLHSLPETVKRGKSAKVEVSQDDENEDESAQIDFGSIKNSVLDEGKENQNDGGFKFNFDDLGPADSAAMDFQIAKEVFEKEFIIHALKINKGKINQTALKANIPKKTLLRKIEKYEINPKSYY